MQTQSTDFELASQGYSLRFLQQDGGLQRTPSGSPTAKSRKKHGIRSGPNKGKLPIDDTESAKNALKLMNHVRPRLTEAEKDQVRRRARKFIPVKKKD